MCWGRPVGGDASCHDAMIRLALSEIAYHSLRHSLHVLLQSWPSWGTVRGEKEWNSRGKTFIWRIIKYHPIGVFNSFLWIFIWGENEGMKGLKYAYRGIGGSPEPPGPQPSFYLLFIRPCGGQGYPDTNLAPTFNPCKYVAEKKKREEKPDGQRDLSSKGYSTYLYICTMWLCTYNIHE